MSKAARIKRKRASEAGKEPYWTEMDMRPVITGASNQSSYNHTMPGAYRRKDERGITQPGNQESAPMRFMNPMFVRSGSRGGPRK